jgi:signal transduction histidine kinase
MLEIKTPEEEDAYKPQRISFAPGEECILTFIVQSAKTNNLLYNPVLVTDEYAPVYTKFLHFDPTGGVSIGYTTTGILLLMIFFSLANYLQSYRREFLYYCGFALFIGLLFFFKAFDYHQLNKFVATEEEIIDFLFQLTGHLFFVLFTIRFLETKQHFPRIYTIQLIAISLLSAALLLFTGGYLLNIPYPQLAFIENLTKYCLLLLGIFFVIVGLIYYKDKVFRYLLFGNIALLAMGITSQLMSQFKTVNTGNYSFLSQSLFYYQLGIVLELGFYLVGLVYKNYRDLAEKVREQERLNALNERSELEKQLAVYSAQQDERNRISADMHDELGAGMTAIRLMSEIAIAKTAEHPIQEVQRISDTANDMVGKLNAIVWSMSTANDSVNNLISYIKGYAHDYYENIPVKLVVNIPEHIEERELSGEKRRNLFLCIKESLNNILKHAHATDVTISFTVNDHLVVKIKDNGVGIHADKMSEFGNGLKNMKKRMEKLGGSFSVSNNNGTETILSVPLS